MLPTIIAKIFSTQVKITIKMFLMIFKGQYSTPIHSYSNYTLMIWLYAHCQLCLLVCCEVVLGKFTEPTITDWSKSCQLLGFSSRGKVHYTIL